MPGFRAPWWLRVALVSVLFSAATVTRADPDLWGHVRFGLDTLRLHHLTALDPYSFTQDVPWVNHEWLSETQMAIAYGLGGAAGLSILKGLLASAVFLITWATLGRVRLLPKVVAAVLLVMGTLHMWATMRPQLWSLLAVAVLSCLLVRGQRRSFLWLPLLFAMWANCHGGWIVGLGVLGAWAFMSVVARPRELWVWAGVVLACTIGTLVNPYGWGLWAFMFHTVRMSRSIAEWGSLWGSPGLNWLPWFAVCAAAARSLWPLDRHGSLDRLRPVFVLSILAYASARVMRIESLFICAGVILLSPWLASKYSAHAFKRDPTRFERWLAVACTVTAALLAAVFLSRSLTCLRVFGDWVPDAGVAQVLRGSRPGRLVTFFDWGEYAIWHFGDRLRVSMDGRRETVYSDDRLIEHDAIVAGTQAGLTALAAWRAEYVWLPARSVATKHWLADHGYRIEADGPRSFVAVRADLPRLAPQGLAPRADCFPE